MGVGTEIGDAYISVHADTKPFRAEIAALRKSMSKEMGKLNKDLKTSGTVGEKALAKVKKKMIETRQETVRLRHATQDINTSMRELRTLANKTGDSDFIRRVNEESERLKVTLRDSQVELAGLRRGTSRYNSTLRRTIDAIGDHHVSIAGLRKELNKYGDEVDHVDRRHHVFLRNTKALVKFMGGPFRAVGGRISTTWRRMDSTVRAVITAILFAAQPLAAIMSGLGASIVGLAAAAAGAVIALSPLLGLLPALVVGGIGIVSVFKEMDDAWKDFTDTVKKNALEGMLGKVKGPIEDLLDTLEGFFSVDVFSSLGDAIGGIITTLNETLSSDAGKRLKDALLGPLADALETIGSALTGPLLTAFLEFVSATAPIAELLATMFEGWAESVGDFFAKAAESGELYDFFRQLLITLDAVMDLFGSVKNVLGTLFQAALGPGTKFVDLLTGLLDQWNAWMNSIEGQKALEEWFGRIGEIMPPLFDLIGAVGKALADLVTPEVIADIGSLLGSLGDIMPVLGDLLSVVGSAHIVQALSEAIQILGAVLKPLAPILTKVLTAFSDDLIEGLKDLEPVATELGEAIGDILEALAPLLPVLLDAALQMIPLFVSALQSIVPIIQVLGPLIAQIAELNLAYFITILQVATTVLDGLNRTFGPLLTGLGNLITKGGQIAPPMKTAQDALKGLNDFLVRIGVGIRNLGSAIGNFVRNPVNTLSTWRQNAITAGQQVLAWFHNLPTNIGRYFNSLPNVISGPFKTAFNAIARAWNNTVGRLSWTVPSWVPGIGGNKVAAPKLPTYMYGGVVDEDGVYRAGEKGKRELVVPLEQPLNRIDPSVRYLAAIAQGKSGLSSSTSTDRSVTLAAGAIQVNAPNADANLVAASVLDRLVANSR